MLSLCLSWVRSQRGQPTRTRSQFPQCATRYYVVGLRVRQLVADTVNYSVPCIQNGPFRRSIPVMQMATAETNRVRLTAFDGISHISHRSLFTLHPVPPTTHSIPYHQTQPPSLSPFFLYTPSAVANSAVDTSLVVDTTASPYSSTDCKPFSLASSAAAQR